MSITTEIARLQQAKEDLKQAINDKGGDITNELLSEYHTKIEEIDTIDLPIYVYDPTGSPGSKYALFYDEDNEVGYFGTVSHTDLWTADGFSTEIGMTDGVGTENQDIENEALWIKYSWKGGIHFWRKTIRNEIGFNHIWEKGCALGTGTNTCRKGHEYVEFGLDSAGNTAMNGINQDKTVTKGGITYKVRLLEGSDINPTETGSNFDVSEFNLIMLNLHNQTAFGVYDSSRTGENWDSTFFDTNYIFRGWYTEFLDAFFQAGDITGRTKWCQEERTSLSTGCLGRGYNNLSVGGFAIKTTSIVNGGWAPVLTVDHPKSKYEAEVE